MLTEKAPAHAGKIIFADQLRAVAVLSVMAVHLLGVYWVAREVVASHILAPVLQGPNAKVLSLVDHHYFNFGPFGVALFFVISGFVIPFSLSRSSRGRFIAARALRIYPAYVACLVLGLLVAWLSSLFWQTQFRWDFTHVIRNALLIANLTNTESIDMVNWSLAIEIKFYLLAAVMGPWIERGRILPLLLVSTGIAFLLIGLDLWPVPASAGFWHSWGSFSFQQVGHDLLFIPFMLSGTMFVYHLRGQITHAELVMAVLGFLGIFLVAWPHTVLGPYFPLVPLNYVYALIVFSAAYAFRHRFRSNAMLDWLAAISYPLYALHAVIGYAAIRFLTASGVTYYLAVTMTLLLVLGLAWIVHAVVEEPTREMGRRIMRRREILPAGDGAPSDTTVRQSSKA